MQDIRKYPSCERSCVDVRRRMLRLRGILFCVLLGIVLIDGSGCTKRCRPGSVLSNGRCVPPDGSNTATNGGATAQSDGNSAVLAEEQAMAGASASPLTGSRQSSSMQQAGSSAAVDTMGIGAAAGNSGSSAESATATSCQISGGSRCNPEASKSPRVESCISGKWEEAQICASEETCVESTAGQASCAPMPSAPAGCSGIMCSGVCVPDDEKNCGSCGHDCTQLAHVSGPASCTAGVCSFPESSCEPGFAHCSSKPDDGCETSLSNEKNCGGCGVECSAAEPVCALPSGANASSRSYACSTGCSDDAPVLCGMSCIDVMSDPEHCGGCDSRCPTVSNGQAVCESGRCAKKCNANHHLCGEECVSDKSPESCGAQCSACLTPTGAQASCDGRVCGFTCTNSRALKCDDGCYPSDDRNCGACGNDCASSGKLCDGARCVECRGNSDCRGSERYCVVNQCKACQPGDASTCGSCQQCSATGTCVSSGTSKTCYQDADGDGYGKGSPMMVCGQCPSGYVDNDRDCYDVASDANSADVHPGQTMFFEKGYAGGNSFDYDCNGRAEVQNPSWKVEGCTCSSGMTCTPITISSSVLCGQRPKQCSGGMCTTSTSCLALEGYPQPCR